MEKIIKYLICFKLLSLIQCQDIVFQRRVINMCSMSALNMLGYCMPIMDCPAVKENRLKFQICGWNGNIPDVCCLYSGNKENLNVYKGSVLSKTPNPIPKNFIPIGKRPSVAKCEEYRESLNPWAFDTTADNTHGISGGENADPGEFPHMALIGWTLPNNRTEWNCGGSIISEKFILTAAHCQLMDNVEPDKVRIGEYDLRSDDENANAKEARIKRFILHPDYRKPLVYNDIALIEIHDYISFRKDLRPACLHQDMNTAEPNVIATGLGQIEFGGVTASILQKVVLAHFNKTSCEEFYPTSRKIKDGIQPTQICYGDSKGLKGDTCQGDSGGPIQVVKTTAYGAKVYDIVGITSTGSICGFNVPGIYTKVSEYIDWIESYAWPTVSGQ